MIRGITSSGKTESSKLLVNQLLRLSARSKKEGRIAEQVKSLFTVLDAFGNAKTLLNPNASRHGRYLELHFNERGRVSGAKILTFGLDKSRLNRLAHEERTYHIFYQLLAGATTEERDRLGIEDPSDYSLLASSGCYRLPGGPFSDDATAMTELRLSMRALGFKSKHVNSIFNLLVAILLLSNLEFTEGVSREDSAHISNLLVLDQISRLLGISTDDLTQALTNRTSYVRKEMFTVLLDPEGAVRQRDSLMRDLYAIIFAFVVETANHKLGPNASEAPPPTQIVILDQPGYQSRTPSGTNSVALTGNAPLLAAYGQNRFEEFCINFQDELLHSYVLRNTFEDSVGLNALLTGDGITLPSITTMDNAGCIELLRGAQLSERAHRKPGGVLGVLNRSSTAFKQGKGGDKRDEDTLQDMMTKFGVHASFVSSPALGGEPDRNLFGINHYAGSCSYDITNFVEKDTDLLDASFVSLLRNSTDSFVAKLVSGPSLATETHSQDPSIIVQAQVSSRPLRHPTPISTKLATTSDEPNHLDPSRTYPITTQLNHNLSELFASLDRTHLWTVSCIRPNDSGSPNSFDKRRVKAQIRALLLPDLVARRKTDFVVDYGLEEFCERYVPTMMGEVPLRIRQCAQKNGLKEGTDYILGHRMIWLTYSAWKLVDDGVREQEKESRKSRDGATVAGDDDESFIADDAATEHTADPSIVAHGQYTMNGSEDNLLLTRTTANGHTYLTPNSGGNTPRGEQIPEYSERDEGSAWGSDWDKKGDGDRTPPHEKMLKGTPELVVHSAPNTVEEVPSSRSRRFWLFLVRICTWWIPDFLLSSIGRMKRPDIRLAWREKVTICFIILLICCVVIFYIVFFGLLLCPDLNKAWDLKQLGEHTGDNDFFVAVAGRVYDVSNFVHGDHSDIAGEPSNGEAELEAFAGQDITDYFPPPLQLACAGLVSDPSLSLQYANFSAVSPVAVHWSGELQSAQGTKLDNANWYTQTFLPTINQYHKGPLVYTKKDLLVQAQDPNINRQVLLLV